jgi:hypothetical protein
MGLAKARTDVTLEAQNHHHQIEVNDDDGNASAL